jgi:hypothetical protein
LWREASGRAPLPGNLKDEGFEGCAKCPASGPPSLGALLGNLELEGFCLPRRLREMNSMSQYLS